MGWEWLASLQSIVDLIGKLIPRREMIPPTHRGFKFRGDEIFVLLPGVHWYWPFRSLVLQKRVNNRLISLSSQYLMTQDGKTVWVDGSVLISNYVDRDDLIRAFVVNDDIDEIAAGISMACLNETMEATHWEEIGDRATFNKQFRRRLRKQLRPYGLKVIRANIETLATGRPILLLGNGK
jgi:regulator of protease activity HflC (stomatin/prohibitin superfamily)